ncbi:MAG: sulfurtransferase [Luteimonas sp.]|nr:sulfurtransferase [Luteimonas sp.]
MNEGWQTLVQPDELQPRLGDACVVVVDCRFSLADTTAGETAYRIAHLPGARYAHLDRDLSGTHTPGAGRHPWPRAAVFTATLGAWGISPDSRVVAYDGGDGAHAARLWCLLRALGHRKVAVLDGGWQRWIDEARPVDALEPSVVPVVHPSDFDEASLLDPGQVQAHLDAGGVLIDARAAERFRGEVEPIDPVAGHVPGAMNRPYALNLEAGRFKAAAELRSEFEALLNGRSPSDVVAMCGSGVTACHHLLAMAHAGLPGAKLFTGSWSGWIEDPARPIAVDG